MSKRVGLIGLVVLIFAVAGALLFTQIKKPSNNIISNSQVGQRSEAPQTTKGSIKSLMAAGKNVSCEINNPDANIKGQTFVAGNKVRGDFAISDPNKGELKSYMLSDGTYVYMWTDNSKTGTKIKIDAINRSSTSSASAKNQGADLDQQVDLKCADWNVDNSKFVVPTDIQFSDLSNLIKSVGSSSTPKTNSSICDQLSDPESKAACLKAMSGN